MFNVYCVLCRKEHVRENTKSMIAISGLVCNPAGLFALKETKGGIAKNISFDFYGCKLADPLSFSMEKL